MADAPAQAKKRTRKSEVAASEPSFDAADTFEVLRADGGFDIYAKITREQAASFAQQGVPVASEMNAAAHLALTAASVEGVINRRPDQSYDRWLSPKLTVPKNYYTRVQWSKEYMEQDSWVESLTKRDIDQAIKKVEFQLDEKSDEGKVAKRVLEEWAKTLNEGIQHNGGLHGYNKRTAKRLIEASLVVAIANWGPLEVDGEFYQVPKVIQNLDPEKLVPYKDPFSAVTTYYYKISARLAERLRATRRPDNAWRQMIPRLGENIVDALPREAIDLRQSDEGCDPQFFTGPFLRLPPELVYVVRGPGDDEKDYPTPSLVPIFSALGMKRKLQLADWAVADGMINMLIVFSFPAGADANVGKSIVKQSMGGGRVQGLSIPAQVKVEILTPPSDILNSKDKFWVPISEILVHFGFPLNSESRSAGDLDSGPLDSASNASRLDALRDPIEDIDNFWLRQIKLKNKWNSLNPTVLMQRIDYTNAEAFRSHALALFDRGDLSIETLLDTAGTTVEREVARRERERDEGIEKILEIRPSFSQTTGVPGDGRTPDDEANPKSGNKENRPKSSGQNEHLT